MEDKKVKDRDVPDNGKEITEVNWETEYKKLASDVQRLSLDYRRLGYINRALVDYGIRTERTEN